MATQIAKDHYTDCLEFSSLRTHDALAGLPNCRMPLRCQPLNRAKCYAPQFQYFRSLALGIRSNRRQLSGTRTVITAGPSMTAAVAASFELAPADHALDAWETIFGFATDKFSGFAGEWMTWTGDTIDAHNQQPTRCYPALRLFKKRDVSGGTLQHKNIYGFDTPFGPEERRPDGNYEMSWYLSKEENLSSEGFYHPFVPCKGPLRYRALSPTDGCYVGLCFALPFEEHVAVSAAAGPAPGSWMLESFITHGFKRWSITPNYALDTRRLKVVIQIREFWTEGEFDDEQLVDFLSLDLLKPAVAPLSKDPAEWLSGGGWDGERAAMTFRTDGIIEKLPAVACDWAAPNPAAPGARLCLLTDSCYAYVPEELPAAAASGGDPVRVEVGVMVADGILKRNITEYDAVTGMARSIAHECFRRIS